MKEIKALGPLEEDSIPFEAGQLNDTSAMGTRSPPDFSSNVIDQVSDLNIGDLPVKDKKQNPFSLNLNKGDPNLSFDLGQTSIQFQPNREEGESRLREHLNGSVKT